MTETYRVVFHAKGDAETIGLPDDAFVELIKTLGVVSRDPWVKGAEDRLVGDAAFRWVSFDHGLGVAHFRVQDADRVITVHSVTWTG